MPANGRRDLIRRLKFKVGKRPVSKSELTNRNLKQFIRYIKSIDLEKINHCSEQT